MRCFPRHWLLWVVLLGCFFAVTPAFSAELRAIRVTGNTAATTREILDWLSSRPGLAYSETIIQNDLRLIGENLRRSGYLNARAAVAARDYTPDSAYVDVTIAVTEGHRSIIGAITCTGQHVLTEAAVLEQFETHRGEPLAAGVLEQDIDALLGRYEHMGYPFARCQVSSVNGRPGEAVDSLTVLLTIDEGRRMTIDEIKVEGNRETNAAVIVRETRLAPGELYNPGKVSAIKSRLNRLNIFSSVAEPELYFHDAKGGLLLKVQEGNTNTFDGIMGYVPGSGAGQQGYLTGLVTVSMRNLFGTGRKLNVNWQRMDRNSQELGLRYVEPWIFGAPINVGAGFLQRQQDSSYVQRALDAQAELMLSEVLSVGLVFRSENVIPSADSLFTSSTTRSATASVGGNILYDTRNDLISPTEGARYQIEYTYGRKRILDDPASGRTNGSAAVQRLVLDMDFYVATFGRQVMAVGVHGHDVRSGRLDESDMFRFGGASTLRGYRENQFLGARVAWTNLEYRFLLGRRSFVFGFVDMGYYSRPADEARGIQEIAAFKYGYGVGLRTDTALGNLGISFALGQGDSFSTAKIHFGLINDF